MRCDECVYHVLTECHRFPPISGFPIVADSSWCGEFKAREVIVCPVVEEKAKAEEVKVEEKAVESEPVKRGWPKGKPRKTF